MWATTFTAVSQGSGGAGLRTDDLLGTILNAVQEFSGREPEDDITLVVARCNIHCDEA